MLFISLFFSVSFAVVCYHATQAGKGLGLVVVALGFLAALTAFQSILLLLQAVLLGLAVLSTVGREMTGKQVVFRLTAATVLTYSLMSIPAYQFAQKHAEKQQGYPLESLAERLAYEQEPVEKLEYSQDALGHMESRLVVPDTSEVKRLKKIHRSVVTRFINSPGFGVGRIFLEESEVTFQTVGDSIGNGTSPARIDGPIRLPSNLFPDVENPLIVPPESLGKELDLLRLGVMHEDAVIDFAHPAGYGYIHNRRQVAGFQPHHFSRIPAPGGENWTMQNLQLISLLKHDQPVAYVSDHLPRMKDARSMPTRQLLTWEKEMLVHLQKGEDVQFLTGADQIYMLGSIRAARPCLACHDAQRGQLLGAFTYLLRKQ